MALTLHLLRHAKSSWDDRAKSDHDRVLNARGRRAAKTIGSFLAREGPEPVRVLCSSAARTQETWERIAAKLAGDPELRIERGLYLASAGEMLEQIRQQGGDAACLLVLAHNPGTEDLARGLAGGGDEDAWHRVRGKFPTAGLATLRFEIDDWKQARTSGGELLRFVVPRELD